MSEVEEFTNGISVATNFTDYIDFLNKMNNIKTPPIQFNLLMITTGLLLFLIIIDMLKQRECIKIVFCLEVLTNNLKLTKEISTLLIISCCIVFGFGIYIPFLLESSKEHLRQFVFNTLSAIPQKPSAIPVSPIEEFQKHQEISL